MSLFSSKNKSKPTASTDKYLGKYCRDKISNIEGYVVNIILKYGGQTQYAVQPSGDGKTMPDVWYIDPLSLELVADKTDLEVTTPTSKTWINFKIGDIIRDKLSGVEGTLYSIIIHINGCISFVMSRKGAPDDKSLYDMIYDDHTRFELVSVSDDTPKKTKTGGPSVKAFR